MSSILVISPHLDDAALDCGDHILHWTADENDVTVINVFTSFQTTTVSTYQQQFLDLLGVESVSHFERLRMEEDRQAMRRLGVNSLYLDFVDAGFRTYKGSPLFTSYQELCSGEIVPQDRALTKEVAAFLKHQKHHKFESVVIPLGVGMHEDHLIVREAAEAAFPRERISYYVDFPYARNPRKWRWPQLCSLLWGKKTFKWTSREKREILNCYRSQMPFLYRRKPFFPEIIIGPVMENEMAISNSSEGVSWRSLYELFTDA